MLLRELQRLEPDARRVSLGSHEVWMWQTIVPAFTFDNLLFLQADQRAIEIKARKGFQISVAQVLLDLVVQSEAFDPQAKTISVLTWPGSPHMFEQAVIAPPKVAHCFNHQSEVLERACFWAFPSYSGEFKTGQDEAEFEATIRRAGEVNIVEWDREPAPHIKFQLLDAWPGGMLAKRKKPLQLPFRILSKYIWELPIERVRVRLQDILGRELEVFRDAKGLVFSGETLTTPARIEKPDRANRRLLSFLGGGDF